MDAIPRLLNESENQLKILQSKEKVKIGGLTFLHTALSYELDDHAKITHVYLTSRHNQFLKIRFTYDNTTAEANERILQDFLQDSAKLWPAQ